MIINPQVAIDNGWVTGIINLEKQVQPNAIDFTLNRLFTITNMPFFISEDDKVMRGGNEVAVSTHYVRRPSKEHKDKLDVYEVEAWELQGQTTYDGMSDVYVNVPQDVAVLPTIVRSTYNRNAVFITSGLYDSGYKGHIGFAVHNNSRGPAYIAPGTRIGQIIFVKAESASMYAGQWSHDEGTHYTGK